MRRCGRLLLPRFAGLLMLVAIGVHGADEPTAPAVWLDASGRPTAEARVALALLAAAGDDGLSPDDYDATALGAEAAQLTAAQAPAPERSAALDARLTAATACFLRHLHQGRMDPRLLSFRMTVADDHLDFTTLARGAATSHRIAATVDELRPQLPLYASLRAALARYRELAAREDAEPLPAWPLSLQPRQR